MKEKGGIKPQTSTKERERNYQARRLNKDEQNKKCDYPYPCSTDQD